MWRGILASAVFCGGDGPDGHFSRWHWSWAGRGELRNICGVFAAGGDSDFVCWRELTVVKLTFLFENFCVSKKKSRASQFSVLSVRDLFLDRRVFVVVFKFRYSCE